MAMKVCFGDFTLDDGARQLRGPQGEVRLSPKSFELLTLLAERWPAAVSKVDLHKAIWPETFVSDDSLARLVTEVRAALGDNAREPRLIRTVHGFGYAMASPVSPQAPAATAPPAAARPDAESQHPPPPSLWRRAAPWVLAASAPALAAVAWLAGSGPDEPRAVAPQSIQFTVAPPDNLALSPSASVLAVAPDGSRLAFLAGTTDGTRRLWVRPLDSPTPYELAGTDGALGPFWSPDSQQIAFFADNDLRVVNASGGPVQTICEAGDGTPGGTWSAGGTLLFGGGERGIFKVAASGGAPVQVTQVDPARERGHILPAFLPDGRRYLYVSRRLDLAGADIHLSSLDGTGSRYLLTASSQVHYVDPGYLLFLKDDALFAQGFDAASAELRGSAVPLPYVVGRNRATARGMFSASHTGVLAFRAAPAAEFSWFDRRGLSVGVAGIGAGDSEPALAPDGRSLAFTRTNAATGRRGVWTFDTATGTGRHIAATSNWNTTPIWSPDGQRVAYRSMTSGRSRIMAKAVHEASEEQPLVGAAGGLPTDWSTDGRYLLFQADGTSRLSEVWWADLTGAGAPARLSGLGAEAYHGRFSPDGRWAAYTSNESGRFEVYVVAFPGGTDRVQVSAEGGVEPHWRGDGRELFYLTTDGSLMAVPLEPGRPLRVGSPAALFRTRADPSQLGIVGRNQYVVSTDGHRFLIRQPSSGGASPPVTVVVNWTALLPE